MKFLLSSGVSFLFVLLGVFTAREWWADRVISRLISEPGAAQSSERAPGSVSSLREAPSSLLHPASVSQALFLRLASQAQLETDPAKRMVLWCEALEAVGKAVQAEPRNAQYLINWANVRQLLGDATSCDRPLTQGSFAAAAQAALDADPTNVNVRFAAAHIFEWAGRRSDSLQQLSRVLLLGTSLSSEQRSSIGGRLTSPSDVEAVVPGRFPQIAEWSMYLRFQNAPLFHDAQEQLTRLQLKAIEESRIEQESGSVPADIHERRLLLLYRAPASAAVRRALDREIASQSGSRGQSQLAQYLRERQDLAETDIVRARESSDTRPLKQPLLHWSPVGEFCFDDFYTSVGFYLPNGESPKLIELRSKVELDPGVRGSMRVYVSEDNRSWSELQGNVQYQSVTLGDSHLIAIRPNSTYFKYWKIAANSSTRSRTFCDSAEQLLVVYRTGSGRTSS